jgi:BirA family biotin operon repressor/biotin-[acetyl-CoA-carboxylase] ligase
LVNIAKRVVNGMKGQILKALRESGDYVSGEMLSDRLGTSRVSIWKHIHSLKEDGYIVEASPKGYRLVSSPDLLLPCEFPSWEEKIHYFREIGSTMDVAKDLAKKGAEEGTIIVAEHQAGGRGRLKREWLSPRGGIYFTLILRPKLSPVYAPRINLMASVAVAKTIGRLFGLRAELKWPNDVLIEGKKVCGILAEMDAETDVINFVNLGVGINANTPITQLGEMATSLKDALGKEISRKELLSSVLTEIAEQKAVLTKADLLEEWKSLSATLNRDVKIVAPGEVIVGRAIDIDTSGALIIRERDGSLRSVVAGDCIHLMKEAPNTK